MLSDPAEEIRSLLKALVLFQFDSVASSLQRDYSELLQLMETALPEIWTDNLQQGQTPVSHTQAPIDCFSGLSFFLFLVLYSIVEYTLNIELEINRTDIQIFFKKSLHFWGQSWPNG